ncbi:integrase repeat-containing protein [Pseudomonas knackmussii]|uniref:integrase repeat-containing protein n=1 Tax=Pseudomonas knackmussii TaxID=65741 RepID=UPI003F49FB0F
MPKKQEFYTYEETQAAVQALGIKNPTDYRKRYSEDPKLPDIPELVYANSGRASWDTFLEIKEYKFYAPHTAAQALGVKSQSDYRNRNRNRNIEDPRLPAQPRGFLFDPKDWEAWKAFLHNSKPSS